MVQLAKHSRTGGSVAFDLQSDGILFVRYTGPITLEFTAESADYIIEQIEKGVRAVLYDVGESTPEFTPVSLLDEVRRVGRAGNRMARFAYLAPENMFTKHFMLIEAAAFNDGIQVKFFSDEDEARTWLLDRV